jgi:hypothetical protein
MKIRKLRTRPVQFGASARRAPRRRRLLLLPFEGRETRRDETLRLKSHVRDKQERSNG